MNEVSKQVSRILKSLTDRVPRSHYPLEDEDLGFLIVMAICKHNGSHVIGNKIFHGDMLIGDSLNYRFDGDYIKIAYMSKIKNELVTTTMRIV
jgi:hypothetical protein